jgi:hypothetical protein
MPRWGATLDERRSPPWTRGDFRGVLNAETNPPRRYATAVAVVRSVADEHGTPTTPAVAAGPDIPSSTEEGSLLPKECLFDSGTYLASIMQYRCWVGVTAAQPRIAKNDA